MNKRNGISLIVLVITILVMIILAGVVVVTMSENNPINKAKEANFKSDIATFQEDLSMHIANKLAMDSALKVTDIDAKGYDAIKKVVNSFTKKYENKIEVVDGKIVYVGTDKDELAWAGGAGVTSKAGMVNAPVLSSGMIPVKYNGTKWEICDSKDPSWYNYENKQWANVMLSDGKYKAATPGTVVEDADLGSMFVWIPRFAYSINKYKTAAAGAEGQTQNIHDISFLTGTTNSDVDGKVYGKSYDAKNAKVGQPTPKIVHPAFNFGGVEKEGIWVAKFEASMNEDGTGHTNQNTSVSCDFADANNIIKILPGKVTWRYISIGNAFTNCLNMTNNGNMYGLVNVDSHLLKNTEWGAVSYLATSKYGFTPTFNGEKENVVVGTDKYNIWSGGNVNKYRANKSQSTTGNETGIYDMNGGAWEFTAIYYANKNNNIGKYGSTMFSGNVLAPSYEKYFDKCEVGSTEGNINLHSRIWDSVCNDATYGNNIRKTITNEKFDLMANIHGDGMYEVANKEEYSYYGKVTPSNNYNWIKNLSATNAEYGSTLYNGDLMLIGNIYFPFLLRGGSFRDGTFSAGIFASGGHHGGPYNSCGFRPVLINN